MQRQCDGCSEPASSFQCPLCQAELITDRGFFCSQKCFAKKWISHRQAFHKSGVVRVKQARDTVPSEEGGETIANAPGGGGTRQHKKRRKGSKATEKAEEKEEVVEVRKKPVIVPWVPLPRGDSAERVEPPLPLDVSRAVIGGASSDRGVAFWSAAHAAALHIAAELSQNRQLQREEGADLLKVLVIAADVLGVHAMAWACRCCGLAHVMKLVVNTAETPTPELISSTYFGGDRQLVIATQDIVGVAGDGSAGEWLPASKGLLVTLPGVRDATRFQPVHMRALFFVYSREAEESVMEELPGEEGDIKFFVRPLQQVPAELHSLFDPSQATSGGKNEDGEGHRKGQGVKQFRFDNDVSTSLARGEVRGALQHLVRLYSAQRGVFEEVLANSFLASLGAVSVVHAHHMLAYVLRELVDHSSRFKANQGATLKDMTIRAVTRVISMLQPITIEVGSTAVAAAAAVGDRANCSARNDQGGSANVHLPPPSRLEREKYFNHYTPAPNLQLQATLCYLYPHTTISAIDAWGAAWGVTKILKGPEVLAQKNVLRKEAVLRLESRYGTKLGPSVANYLVILMHFLYDAVAGYSLALDDVERRTQWSLTLGNEVGTLTSFLSNCFLLHTEEPATKERPTLSSRKVTPSTDELLELRRRFPVRAATAEKERVPLPWADLPIAGNRALRIKQLRQQAVEEILMAMPRKPRPMYIGDVGNLVGKWFRFNTRFEGVLGVSLMEFLIQHPEAFRVVGDLVTRRTAGTCSSVPIRFHDDSGDDDDEGFEETDKNRKAKDRALLTGAKTGGKRGAGRELSSRARKKAAAKAFNQSRFNRNYKPLDPSAKVPGYVRHAPRKVKGRGRKANKRNTKRG